MTRYYNLHLSGILDDIRWDVPLSTMKRYNNFLHVLTSNLVRQKELISKLLKHLSHYLLYEVANDKFNSSTS